jgi:hypothetical protein
MKYFSVVGERCSGTTFLVYALLRNFNLIYRLFQGKHFFGHGDDEVVKQDPDIDETLFIYVVRHPIDWIDSFFKRLHHVAPENKKSITNFLNNEFYSIYEEGEQIHGEMMADRHIFTGERYKNIFELRKTKTDYLLHHFSKKVKHFMVLKYEDLRDDYENTLNRLCSQFKLVKANDIYQTIPKYKGTYTALYYKKPILLSEDIIEEIKQKVDVNQESILGYTI